MFPKSCQPCWTPPGVGMRKASRRHLATGPLARGAAPSLAGLTLSGSGPQGSSVTHLPGTPCVALAASPADSLSAGPGPAHADSELEPGVPVALSYNSLGSGYRLARADGLGLSICGVAGQQTPGSQPGTCLPSPPGCVGPLGAETSEQSLAPGPLRAGEPGLTPVGRDTSSRARGDRWPLTLAPTSSQTGPRALRPRPDSVPSQGSRLACPSAGAARPHRPLPGRPRAHGASHGGSRGPGWERAPTQSPKGVCASQEQSPVWGEGGAGGQVPTCRPWSREWGGPGRASLWRSEVGPGPGHLRAPRPKGWWQGRWGWGGVPRDGDDGALWVWGPQAWERGGGWPCSGPAETSLAVGLSPALGEGTGCWVSGSKQFPGEHHLGLWEGVRSRASRLGQLSRLTVNRVTCDR